MWSEFVVMMRRLGSCWWTGNGRFASGEPGAATQPQTVATWQMTAGGPLRVHLVPLFRAVQALGAASEVGDGSPRNEHHVAGAICRHHLQFVVALRGAAGPE